MAEANPAELSTPAVGHDEARRTPFPSVDPTPDFPRLEHEVLAHWDTHGIFERSIRQREAQGAPDFVFYDGPPFATGLPHYGHLLTSYIKDTIPRFWTMRGYRVERRFGWDCHGLPVEMEVEKQLGLDTSAELERYGVDRFNEACRSIVLRYTSEWRKTIHRIGRWVDFDGGYLTMDRSFMESVWWVFKQLWDRGLVYHGHRVVPYSWRCATPLSNFEANLNYQEVQDPSVTVRFKARDEEGAWFLAWTTTPWTLPSNLALCVHPDLEYVKVRERSTGEIYYLAAERLGDVWKDPEREVEVLERLPGRALEGRLYEPLLPYAAHLEQQGAFRVVVDTYVTADSGTGIVHQAPAFGEDDYRVCRREGIPLFDPVDADGRFTEQAPDLAGRLVKEADREIIRRLKEEGKLVRHETVVHSYPFCWRTDTPLIYKAISAWYVRVEAIKDRLIANNEKIHWVPAWVGSRRFGNWLADARDWNISRNRYWGACIPLWRCESEDCDEIVCVGSVAELEALSGVRLEDLHKHHVDAVTFPCSRCGAVMRRVPEVFDCWFESGSMPYAQKHYPFENREWFERNFPAHFIGEGLDQTRGWFYTLLVLSSALFDKPAFRNCVVNGLILAADGRKMSKREKNYTAPEVLIERFGSDAVRFYMLSSPVVEGQNLRFVDDEVRELIKGLLLPVWNAYRFFTEYANADRWEPTGRIGGETQPGGSVEAGERVETLQGEPRAMLDRYILSELALTIERVTQAMEDYRLVRACRAVAGFVDTLNNWYIRRSRRRFWRAGSDRDKREAFETLYHVLVTYTKLLAPFAPFVAEQIYRGLTGRLSVHLCDWPEAEPGRIDRDLSARMAAVRRVISAAHTIRARARIKTRQPLGRLRVAGLDAETFRFGVPLVREEVNVKEVERIEDPDTIARRIFRPDSRKLGPRLRGAVQQVIRQAKAGAFELLEDGRVRVGEHVLEPDEYELAWQVPEGVGVEADGELLVALDLEIDDTLRAEGWVRELLRHLQTLRKEAGYAVRDRIEAGLETGYGPLAEAIARHAPLLREELLAVALHDAIAGGRWDREREVRIEGQPVRLAVRRVAESGNGTRQREGDEGCA